MCRFGEKTFKIQDGIVGGPIALFDGSGDAMVVSPASNFMAVSNWHIRSLFKSTSSLAYGIMGGVDTVPPDYTTQYIIYYSSSGVNKVNQYAQFYELMNSIIILLSNRSFQ